MTVTTFENRKRIVKLSSLKFPFILILANNFTSKKFQVSWENVLVNAYFDGLHQNASYICKNFIQFWLNLSCHIQINQNLRDFFNFATIKIFVLIISGKISGKLPTEIFNQLSEMQFLITKFLWQL